MSHAQEMISEKMRQVPAGTLRHSAMMAAKRFKSSWVELGKLLVEVRDQALFTQWGYESFEDYCMKELRIRKATALKLTRSFSFLDRHEPKEMASPNIMETAPAFEVVEVLAGAEERGQLSAAQYKSIRDSIWDSDRPVSELRRDFTERFPAPEGPGPSENAQLKRWASQAKRLSDELSASKKVPKAVAERAAALAEDLSELTSGRAEA